MGMKIGRSVPSSIVELPSSRQKVASHPQPVNKVRKAYNDTRLDPTLVGSIDPEIGPERVEFESALRASGEDGQLVEQFLEFFDVLLASDGQPSALLVDLLYSAVDADVKIDSQFFETSSMLIKALTDGDLASTDSVIILERFAEILQGGRINRKQHAELQALIDTPELAVDAVPDADADLSTPPDSNESPGIDERSEEVVSASVELPPAAGYSRSLTPVLNGVDPQQLDTSFEHSDDVSGLSGQEFIHALYGAGVMAGLSEPKQRKFSQYAGLLFTAYANDDDLLSDDEIILMQDDGVLIETEEGWALEFNTVAEQID